MFLSVTIYHDILSNIMLYAKFDFKLFCKKTYIIKYKWLSVKGTDKSYKIAGTYPTLVIHRLGYMQSLPSAFKRVTLMIRCSMELGAQKKFDMTTSGNTYAK